MASHVKYIVHAAVHYQAYEAYIEWLKEEHISEVIAQPGFVSAELCLRKGGALEASSKDVKVIYTIESEEALKSYLTGPAMSLREKAIEKFQGQFSVTREVWLESTVYT